MVTRSTTWRLLQIASGQHCFHCVSFVQISRCWAIPVSVPTRSGSGKLLPTIGFRGFFPRSYSSVLLWGFRPVTLLPYPWHALHPYARTWLWFCVFLVCLLSANLETSGRPWDGKKPSCGQTYPTRHFQNKTKTCRVFGSNQKSQCKLMTS